LDFRDAPCAGANRNDTKGNYSMKSITILAIALGAASLAACNKSPQEQTADNIEASADNASANIQASADNSADAVRNTGDQKADAVRNSTENK